MKRIRGWLLVRAIFAVVVLAAGWLLGILPILGPKWQAYAPYVALTVVFVLYLVAEYQREIEGRKDTDAYRDHVGDIQRFAKQAYDLVVRRGSGIAFPFGMDGPMGKALRKHFPKQASLVDEWNKATEGFQAKVTAVHNAVNGEQNRLGLSGNGWASVLLAVINNEVEPLEIIWAVQNGQVVAIHNSYWDVSRLPDTPEATERLLLALWDSSLEIRGNPAVVALLDTNRRIDDLVRPLREALAPIEFTHDLPGECDLCPK